MYHAQYNESNFEAAFQELSLKSRYRYYSAIDRIIEKYENIGDDENDDIIDLENMVFIQDKGILRNLKIDKSGIFTKAYEYQSRTEILKIKEITSSFKKKNSSNKITLKKQKGNKGRENFVDTEINNQIFNKNKSSFNRKLCNEFRTRQLSKTEIFENKIQDYLEVKKADLKIKESDSQDLKFSKLVCDELLTNILNTKNENAQKNKVFQNYSNSYFLRKYAPEPQDFHFTDENSYVNKNISSVNQITGSCNKSILQKRKKLNNVNTDFLLSLSDDAVPKFNKDIVLKDVRIIVDKLDCSNLTPDQYFITNAGEKDLSCSKNENQRNNNKKNPLQIIENKINNKNSNFANTDKSLHPAKRIKLDICENSNKTNTVCSVTNLTKQNNLLKNAKTVLDRKSEFVDKNKTSIKLHEENTTLLNNKPTICFLSQLFGNSSITTNVENNNNYNNKPHIIWIKNNDFHAKSLTKNANHISSQTFSSSTKEAYLNISSSSNKQNYKNPVVSETVKAVQQFKEISNTIENDCHVQFQKRSTRQLNKSQILDSNICRNTEIRKDLSKENLSVDSVICKINNNIQKIRKNCPKKSSINSFTETNIGCNFQNIQTHIGKKRIPKQRLNKTMPTINQNGNKSFPQEKFSLSLNQNESSFTNNTILTKQLKNITVLNKKQYSHCYNTRSKCSKSISSEHLKDCSVLIEKCYLCNCTI